MARVIIGFTVASASLLFLVGFHYISSQRIDPVRSHTDATTDYESGGLHHSNITLQRTDTDETTTENVGHHSKITPQRIDLEISYTDATTKNLGHHSKITLEPMVLSLSYWEQTANALKNLFDLQCWASTVNISKVVMPAIESYNKSVFHFSLNVSSLQFLDLFDLEYWNSMSQSLGYSPLVSLEHFLSHANRNMVYVQLLNRGRCLLLKYLKDKWWYKLLTTRFHFNIKKTVCINFKHVPSHVLRKQKFQQKLFEGTSGNVTLLFNNWRGIRSNSSDRIALSGSKCDARLDKVDYLVPSSFNFSGPAVPSKRILFNIHSFLSRIPEKRYIAVMLRTEKLFRNAKYGKNASIAPENNPCVHDILSDWKALTSKNNLSETLFFSDIGTHGSARWTSSKALKFSQYIQNRLQPKFTLSDINSALESMTKSKDSVQIAVLHQQLVAHATCVVMVGGGSFQSQTFTMYVHSHSKGQRCYAMRTMECKIATRSL